jgi:HlyD family secretion protein
LKPEYRHVLNEKRTKGERTIWIVKNDVLQPLKVKTGLNTGTETEIISDQLKEGMVVVTGKETMKAVQQNSGSGSPFLPTPPKRNQKKK